MTHFKWLVAKTSREDAEEYAQRVQDREGWDYCEVQECLGTVEEVYQRLLKEGPEGQLARLLKAEGISVDGKLEWLRALIEKGKGGYRVYVIDCHM